MRRQPNLIESRTPARFGEPGGVSLWRTSVGYSRYSNSQSPEPRGGFTIIEMIGTCLLLGILFFDDDSYDVARRSRKTIAEQRQFALQQAANLLEGATKRDWSDLEPGELRIPDPDRDLQAVLPGLQQTLVVKQLADEIETRQIIASIRWQNRAGELVNPLRLSAWVHSMKEVP